MNKQEFVDEFFEFIPKQDRDHYNTVDESFEKDYEFLFNSIVENIESLGLLSHNQIQELHENVCE